MTGTADEQEHGDDGDVAATPRLADLPERVQVAVLDVAARALSEIATPRLRGDLRRFQKFAPARRARLAGPALVNALDDDAAFRDQVAEAAGDLDEAVRLFLRRPAGWADALPQRDPGEGLPPVVTVDPRVEERTTQLRQELSKQRAEHRAQIAQIKAENATLRQTLHTTRTELAAAREEASRSAADLDATRAAAAATERRLSARVDDLTGALAAERRARRETGGAQDRRVRLLMEALGDTVSGLRKELALPPSDDELPADTVNARTPGTGGGRLLEAERGADALRGRLSLPRSHLVVDGYNVSKTAWPSAALSSQRTQLVSALAGVRARTGAEVTVVFDGADLTSVPAAAPSRGVRVLFSPQGITADDVIRELVGEEPAGRVVIVATSDNAVAVDVAKAGAQVVASSALVAYVSGAR